MAAPSASGVAEIWLARSDEASLSRAAARSAGDGGLGEGTASLLALLQYADSAYPAGGFAHSWGLETAVAEGQVTDARSLAAACRTLLERQVGRTDAVAAAACCEAARTRDLERITLVDRRLSAMRVAREAREASTRVGRRMIETAARAEDLPWLRLVCDGVRAGRLPGNAAAMQGVIAGTLGPSPEVAAALPLWSAATGFLNAAMRLVRVTHDDVQAILAGLRGSVAVLAAAAATADPAEMAGSAPQLEIWAMRHEVAEVRLFAS